MYQPAYTQASNSRLAHELIHENPFGALITTGGDGSSFEVNHLPFILEAAAGEAGVLWTHLARANPQARLLRDGEICLVTFQGPNAYISPRHYASMPNVPTWNYAAVQARCRIKRLEGASEIDHVLQMLVDRFEIQEGAIGAWKYDLPLEFKADLIRAILGVKLEILELKGKFKLSQNREADDYAGVLAAFAARKDDQGRALHRLMLRTR